MSRNNFAVTDDIMNVNVKTVPKLKNPYTSVTIENIINEINKIESKLSIDDDSNDSSNTQNSNVQEIAHEKTYKGYDKELNDDNITIKAKLTRVAKNPVISKNSYNEINPDKNNQKLYEFVDNIKDLVREEPYPLRDQRTPFLEKDYSTKNKNNGLSTRSLLEFTLKNSDDIKEIKSKLNNAISSYKMYPDYFHDLVMWNSDIFNNDKVSNPTWQDILKTLKSDQDYTTPDLRDMQKELNEMKEHFKDSDLSHIDGTDIAKLKTTTEMTPRVLSSPRNVDDIKVTVSSTKMKKYPLVDDFNEDPYIVPRNDPKKYANVQSQDIIDVLDNLYTKQPDKVNLKSNIESETKNSEGISLKYFIDLYMSLT